MIFRVNPSLRQVPVVIPPPGTTFPAQLILFLPLDCLHCRVREILVNVLTVVFLSSSDAAVNVLCCVKRCIQITCGQECHSGLIQLTVLEMSELMEFTANITCSSCFTVLKITPE